MLIEWYHEINTVECDVSHRQTATSGDNGRHCGYLMERYYMIGDYRTVIKTWPTMLLGHPLTARPLHNVVRPRWDGLGQEPGC